VLASIPHPGFSLIKVNDRQCLQPRPAEQKHAGVGFSAFASKFAINERKMPNLPLHIEKWWVVQGSNL
jgi:hypothetical protein